MAFVLCCNNGNNNNNNEGKEYTTSTSVKKSWRRRKTAITVALVALVVLLYATDIGSLVYLRSQRFVYVVYDVLTEFKFSISRDLKDIKIYLWTRKNPRSYYLLLNGDVANLASSHFNRSHPTKILVHGFSDRGLTTWIKTFKKAYLDRDEYNVISIDWELLAESPWYTTAAKNAKHVGRHAAEYIAFLVSEGASYESFHVLGASLGAHAAGYVGHFSKGRLGRITGLDPSGPLFHTVTPADRLDPTDALFVDVIHTAGRWVGNDDISGHVDFFPNLGRAPQPGCEGQESLDLTCSHFKAWQMYSETIPRDKQDFFALRCESAESFDSGLCCQRPNKLDLALMGEQTHNHTRGTFYLWTKSQSPHVKPKEESVNCKWTD